MLSFERSSSHRSCVPAARIENRRGQRAAVDRVERHQVREEPRAARAAARAVAVDQMHFRIERVRFRAHERNRRRRPDRERPVGRRGNGGEVELGVRRDGRSDRDWRTRDASRSQIERRRHERALTGKDEMARRRVYRTRQVRKESLNRRAVQRSQIDALFAGFRSTSPQLRGEQEPAAVRQESRPEMRPILGRQFRQRCCCAPVCRDAEESRLPTERNRPVGAPRAADRGRRSRRGPSRRAQGRPPPTRASR